MDQSIKLGESPKPFFKAVCLFVNVWSHNEKNYLGKKDS